MPSRPDVYDRTTITLHWLTVVLVLTLWLVGTFLEDIVPKGALRSGFLASGRFSLPASGSADAT